MANKLRSETLALDVVVNANQAQKNINKLGREITDTTFHIKELQQQQALLAKEGQKDSQAYKDLSKEIKLNRDRVRDLKEEQGKLINNLSLERKTISQLKRQLTDLRKLRANSIPGSEQFKQYSDQIEIVSSRLSELQIGTELTGNSIEKLSGRFKGWIATATATAASFAAITMGIKKAINEYASFDDLLVDVMKTTNLSKDSVKELNEELTAIETRTSQEDLLGLSRIAGKLGYTEISEITEFVRANNQIIVSLNEDLGGNVEETVNKIGKLVDIFKLKDLYSTEEAFLKVGSALNELGMASTANEGYMVEFARRMAGVAPLAKVSIDQILGLGAALDQLGQTEEVSSTALSKLFVKLASEAETYSKYAGMKLTDFKNLLETDFMGAFTKVLQGVKNNANGINELAATLGDLGEDGGRVIGVLGSLANNVDVVTTSMNLANTAMEEGTSITDEYNLKNESAAAQLEKAQKQVKALWIELGEKLWPVMTTGLTLFQIFIKSLSTLVSFISENWKIITILTVAITTYTIAINANIIAQYASARATAIATTATRLWNAALAANPIGLVITAIATLTTALYLKTKRLSEATSAQKALNDIMLEGKKTVAGETAMIEQNISVALDKAKADNVRLAAVKRLREIMPDVLRDYSDEQIMSGKAKKAIEEHTEALIKQAAIRAAQGKLEKLAQQKLEEQDRKERGFSGATVGERFEAMDSETFFSGNWSKAYSDHIDNNIRAIEAQEMKVATFVSELETKLLEKVKVKTEDPDDNGGGNLTEGGASESSQKKAYQKELDAAEKHHQAILQQKNLFREDLSELDKGQLIELAKYQDEYQSKLDSINTKYGESLKTITNTANEELKKRAKAEENYIDSILIKRQTESEAERSAYDDRLKKAGLFGIERESMTKRQLDALEILEREHKQNINKIDADAIAKEIDARIANNRDIITDLRIRHVEELSEIKNLSQAKESLSATLSEKELSQIRSLGQARKLIQNQQMLEEQELLKKQLKELTDTLINAQNSGTFEGITLSDKILSEEETKVLLDRIRQLKEELAKLTGQDKSDELDKSDRDKVDILGMSIEDWEKLFKNVGDTREKILRVADALNGAGQVWGQYNAMVAAKENAQLQKDEAANNKKKDNLKKRLDDGLISQEEYNKQVDKLDKQMDKKKAIVARDQAKRERNVALMTAIVNTAKGITSAFPNPFLMALIAAVGAIQIGTIKATPLPEIPGAETGGNFMDVIRAQDGKRFRAKSDPKRRGYISSPTVLVSEKGKEWVANNDAVENPHIKPLLDVLDTAQRNGTINTMTLSDIASSLSGRIQGRQIGGPVSGRQASGSSVSGSTGSMEVFLKKNIETLEALDDRIANMEVKVALLGKGGFLEKMDEYNNLKNNGSF
ncbi:phage tail tape measure protein [Sphingobacterium cellulitidis]|uniref:phage tail tape measure protein n=1 Tax=Sphingobacterium cellulitidis TaxID=1768011 RepID=UPI000B93FE02|nr:phage tail tape measure protein [Sphingobacterium cellulitidis]OYD47707.1 phage tail tape measure protein [Sphingobacterium cellulitidis]